MVIKKLIQITFFLLFTCAYHISYAQNESIISSFNVREGSFRTTLFKKYQFSIDFGPCDSILLNFSERNNRILKKIKIIAPDGSITSIKNQHSLIDKIVPVGDGGSYTFQFKQGLSLKLSTFFPRDCDLILKKQFRVPPLKPKRQPKNFVVFDTTNITFIEVDVISSDTVFTPIVDNVFILSPQKKISGKQRDFIEVPIPENLDYLAYMVSQEQKQEDENVLNNVLNIQFEKYAKGEEIDLPGINGLYMQFVKSKSDRDKFLKGLPLENYSESLSNYGYRPTTSSSDTLFLCIQNEFLASDVHLRVLVAGVTHKIERDTLVKDSMIIKRKLFDIKLDSSSYLASLQLLDSTQSNLYFARKKLEEDIAKRHLTLDSLKGVKLAELDTIQARLDNKREDLAVIDRTNELKKQQNMTSDEALAQAKLEATQRELQAAKQRINVLEQTVDEIQKSRTDLPSIKDLKLPKDIKGVKPPKNIKTPTGIKSPKINLPKFLKGAEKIKSPKDIKPQKILDEKKKKINWKFWKKWFDKDKKN